MAFLDSLDIANRACQWLGIPRIVETDEDSVANNEISFVYDKLRRSVLRRDVWQCSIKYAPLRPIASTTYLLAPDEWSATTTYPVGAIAKDSNGEIWVSTEPENYNNDPASTRAWDRYFGPMTVHLYDATIEYYAGELVYKTVGNPGSYVIYLSMSNENDSVPSTASAWAATTTYKRGDTVSHSGEQWRSLIELNLNVTPADVPLDWVAGTTYTVGQTALASDGYIYTATGTTVADDPVSDGGVNWTNSNVPGGWAKVPDVYASALTWQPIYAGVSRINLFWPIGLNSRNTYRLPNGFLRQAPQNPKGGDAGGIGSIRYDDWLFEGNYLVTSAAGPLILRFAADVVDVQQFDDLFCEALAAQVAVAVQPKVGQSSAKLADIVSAHKKYMGEARIVNAVEKGIIDLPEDDFLTCRE